VDGYEKRTGRRRSRAFWFEASPPGFTSESRRGRDERVTPKIVDSLKFIDYSLV